MSLPIHSSSESPKLMPFALQSKKKPINSEIVSAHRAAAAHPESVLSLSHLVPTDQHPSIIMRADQGLRPKMSSLAIPIISLAKICSARTHRLKAKIRWALQELSSASKESKGSSLKWYPRLTLTARIKTRLISRQIIKLNIITRSNHPSHFRQFQSLNLLSPKHSQGNRNKKSSNKARVHRRCKD